jgi:hypothetical protein
MSLVFAAALLSIAVEFSAEIAKCVNIKPLKINKLNIFSAWVEAKFSAEYNNFIGYNSAAYSC